MKAQHLLIALAFSCVAPDGSLTFCFAFLRA